MRFPPSFLDELRARLPVSEVVGRRVQLKRSGREWKGLSPFNKEKTASFFVNDQKASWFDFSAQRNGDIFDFVMETEGLGFAEAVERLAAMAGVPMPVVSEHAAAEERHRKSLHDIIELAAKFFEATLASRTGARARGYLADRAIEPATQLKFRVGYAPPERFALKEHLGAQGVSVEDMVEAGLLVAGDDIPVPYDRFRDRVMFPISDLRGRVVAFGGRALDKDAPAKYLNSPETPLFHKGALLYNAASARAATHDGHPLIAVEGYVDVIATVTAGFPATVAPLGTALTEDQLGLLWRMADEPILCFDGDSAGRRAAYRAVDLALPLLRPGKSLLFATLPEGQDPDDLVRSGGRAAIADVLSLARPLADVLWTRETEAGRFDTPERRAGLEARLGQISAAIPDSVRKYYRQDLEQRLRDLFAPAADAYAPRREPRGRSSPRGPRGRQPPVNNLPAASPRLSASSIVRGYRTALPPREALILLAVVNHPWLLESRAEELSELEFLHPDADRLRRALLDAGASHAIAAPETLRESLAGGNIENILLRVEAAVTHAADWPVRPDAAAEDVQQWWAQVVTLHRKSRTLNRELKEAERALGDEPTEENLAWLRDVQNRLLAFEGTEAIIEGFGALSGRPSRA
ncbi:MAG: DNA primase [Xanthobacteraceae bacterium]|nr:DNA primase [Xanthobacteraceae bacterium]MBV9630605.1 DNA primase [Xanthobacteraceae bacterium]